ncbi:hypothetical protein DFH06DRAFT_1481625 [Mycena polygramma]|nr:hypothetical protein DFH06DRAFT_1481625 [Mycena polygramma]
MSLSQTSSPWPQGNTTLKLAEDDSNSTGFLGLPASESMASTSSLYHSALNSPVPGETSESNPPTGQTGDLIFFSSGNLSSFDTPSKPLASSASPSFAIPSSNELRSHEFSSNGHKLAPINTKESGKMPNVYINGLPANFREDQLLAIASPFGEVVSVRCFTRNTTKNPSGYGFVLFKTIAAAEKCIVALKRSDLHPSFSRVKKPPRIVCSPTSPIPAAPSSSSLSGSDQESPSPRDPNFKAKMAQLEDKNSANVYIEGLPLSADRNTLVELVYPHIIQSTRFIRSKLPQSPTMIAFMRMDSRVAAEDVILRLNGKSVQGWDGVESRVYLRIADTLDQRELRRSEASSRDDDGRLSIAQATLLNYRASDLSAPIHLNSNVAAPRNLPDPRLPDMLAATVHGLLTSNPGARRPPLPQQLQPSSPQQPPQRQFIPETLMQPPQRQFIPETLPHPLAASIHDLLAFNSAQSFRPTPFPQDPLYAPYACPPLPQANIHPNVAALFDSLAAMQLQQRYPLTQEPVYPIPPMAGFPNQFNTNASMNVNLKPSVPPMQNVKPNFGQGGGQRTAAEQFVMQAQAEMQRLAVAEGRPPVAPATANPTYQRSPRVTTQFFSPPISMASRTAPVTRSHAPGNLQPRARHLPSPLSNPPAKPPPTPRVPLGAVPPSPVTRVVRLVHHVAEPSVDGSHNVGSPRKVSFASGHARANTAPATPRQQGTHNTEIPRRRERLNTNTNTNTNTNLNINANTNMNTHTINNTNTNINIEQSQNQNLGTFASPTLPPASTRVFLGPQNLVRLPLLRFA